MSLAPTSPTLETARLILRPPTQEDAAAHAELMADPLSAAFVTPDGQPQTAAQSWRTLAMLAGHWAFRGYGFFSLIEKDSGRWAGRAGPWRPEGWPGFEIGWSVHPAFRGQGYALEAAVASARWAFQTQEIDRVISLIRPDNQNSRRVAEKLGEEIVAEYEHVGMPHHIWAIARDRFDALWGL